MKLANTGLLTTIFNLKRNFAAGLSPAKKVFSGIEVAPFKDNAEAAICISCDFEMSWAWRGRDREAAELRGITERQNVPFILRLLGEYSIPITWATVGHLFLESCTRSTSGLAHPHMPRPTVNDVWSGDWYLHDPCSNVRKDPLWYAPDLIQQVIECKTPQEIATHSFSHINYSARCSTPELVRNEMEACIEAMQPFGARPRSLVFPLNIAEYSYLPMLSDAGITAVRHRDANVRLSYPERTPSGVYKIFESMNLRMAKYYDYIDKAKIFIRKARERRAAYALWFHPSDPIELFDTQFRWILQHVDSERSGGRVWVTTMRDLASYCEAREQVQVKAGWDKNTLNLSIATSLDSSKYETPEVTLLIPASSEPKSARQRLVSGEWIAVNVHWTHKHDSPGFMVNIPASAGALQFTF